MEFSKVFTVKKEVNEQQFLKGLKKEQGFKKETSKAKEIAVTTSALMTGIRLIAVKVRPAFFLE